MASFYILVLAVCLLVLTCPSYAVNKTATNFSSRNTTSDGVGGFFLAPYAASAAGSHPGGMNMAIYFWGNPPTMWYTIYQQAPDNYKADVLLPGSYSYKVLNLGGGSTGWSDAEFAASVEFMPHIKSDAGFDGICFDMEGMVYTFSMSKMLDMFKQAKKLGLITILTTTAEGPWFGCDSPHDCWEDIKWDDVDYVLPQMYGPNGNNYPSTEFHQYADFWKKGGGQGVHGKFPGPTNLNKILWTVSRGTGPSSLRELGFGGGYVEWAYKR